MKVGYAKKVIGKRKWRSSKRVKVVGMALQKLFMCCRDVFKGPGTVPFPHEVRRLCHILDKMRGEDVGLSKDLQFFNPKPNLNSPQPPPRVTYTTIYKCSTFSICIFFIPANGVIPLHNHPEMTVFSKLLLGKMHIKAYDWVNDHDHHEDRHQKQQDSSLNPRLRLAKLIADGVYEAPCDASVLYPSSGGNIHSFTAISPCAVLDVIGPPYSKQDSRDSSYYLDHPVCLSSTTPNNKEERCDNKVDVNIERFAWLEEIEMPPNSYMDGIEYLGPQIMDYDSNNT